MRETVRELMTPIAKFPKVPETETFTAAVLALDKAQEDYLAGRCEQRILLVHDAAGRIVGKLSPLDVVQGLEPDYDDVVKAETARVGTLQRSVILAMQDQARLWARPFDDLCRAARDVKIKDFAKRPGRSQVIGADESLNVALHRFVQFKHDSLFVTEADRLVGLLRFSDVYRDILRRIKGVCST